MLTYTYTGDGQLYSLHDSKLGYTYRYTYDSIGRLIGSTLENPSKVLLNTRQEYNDKNQLTKQAWQMTGAEYAQSYTYNTADGTLATVTMPSGQTVSYGYDALRRLSTVTAGSLYTQTYTYRNIDATKTTAQVSNVAYTGFANAPSYGYTYDALGNIATYTQGGKTYTYTYDELNQLTGVVEKDSGGNVTATWSYTYDRAGNIESANGKNYTYGDSQWADLLTAYDGETITYDGSGNPLSYYNGRRYTFTWAEGRRLSKSVVGGTTTTYGYDSDGIRDYKIVNGTAIYYRYASGKLLRQYHSGTNTTLDFLYDGNGMPYAVKCNGTYYYYITNLQGDVLRLIDASGNTVASYTYDPYGNILSATGTMAETNPLRYRGYYYDSETGLYYLQSRYYDPTIGRFLNADAYASTGQGILGHNMFAYCGNNPVNNMDPTGEAWWHWIAAAAVVAVAAIAVVATAGGAAAAVVAVTSVANGVAAGSTAATVAAGAFIGGSTALAVSTYIAVSESNSVEEFADYGESALISTATGMGTGALVGYDIAKSQAPSPQEPSLQQGSMPKHTTSTASPENVSNPGGSHTRLDNKGNIYSYTEYDAKGRQYMRIDFQGKPHAKTLPHIHIYIYPERGGRVQYTFDLNWYLID